MFLVLVALVIIIYSLYYYNKYQQEWKYLENIPGPQGIPLFGSALQIGSTPVEYLQTLRTWWEEYNCDIYKFYVGNNSFVVISNPKDMECALTSSDLPLKGEMYNFLRPWLGDGLLTSIGSKWFKHRKIITPAFHFKILVDFLEVMNKNSNNLIEFLKSKAKSGEIFDIQHLLHYITLDIICETAMGTEINALNNNEAEIVLATQEMCFTIQRRPFNLFKRNNFLYTFTDDYRRQQKALKTYKTFIVNVIENRKDSLQDGKCDENWQKDEFSRKKQAFLDTLLTAKKDDRSLTNDEIYEEVATFMFEGHDTTSSGVSFMSFLLSRHPNIQQKVYDEQKTLFGDEIKTVIPTYQDMQEMKYLDLVIKECQRLYPSVPFIGRFTGDKVFDLAGKIIPPNTSIIPFIFPMGYNEKYFKDPLKFDPERFSSENTEGKNPFEYLPFSAGQRNCIGQKYAILEMKSLISNIIRHYEILPPTDSLIRKDNYEKIIPNNQYEPILATVLTLKSDNGIFVRLRAR